ncbi:MAG: helix-turn-helix transcriptional regulator [Bacteroidales bacterium]
MVERIAKIIQVKKLSASRFADILGVPRSTISHILSGRNNPSLEFIQKVLSSFPEVRVAWLMRGEEPMFISTNTLFSQVEMDEPPPGASEENNRSGGGSGIQPGKGVDTTSFGEATEKTDPATMNRPKKGVSQGKEAAPVGETNFPNKAPQDTGLKFPGSLPSGSNDEGNRPKRAVKVVFVYDDGTFSEFNPSAP